jgi:hypothetical protein
MQLTRPGAGDDELSVVVAGHAQIDGGMAELWRGRSLLGIVHVENGSVLLRLESHARGPLRVDAVALERALAEARTKLVHQTNPVRPGGSA